MDDLIGKSVHILRLHDVTHFDGVGQVGPSIDNNTSNLKDKTMILTSIGVHLTATGPTPHNKRISVLIPYAMCKSIQLKA